MDELLSELFGMPQSEMEKWITPGRYVSGRELADAGMAELIDLRKLKLFEANGASRRRKRVAN